MKYFVADILACPVCKSRNLMLHVIEEYDEEVSIDISRVRCKEYCHYLGKPADQVSEDVCRICVRKRIKTGVLVCLDCGRWYPIMETIPVMLDDDYRDRKLDSKFIREYLDRIPGEVLEKMKIPQVNRVATDGG